MHLSLYRMLFCKNGSKRVFMEVSNKISVAELFNITDISFCVLEDMPVRADIFLSNILGFSRSRVQKNISNENLTVDGVVVSKNSFKKFRNRSLVEFEIEPIEEISAEPEEMPLDIVFENDNFLIVNKPHGLVVHPGAGNKSGTLINGVLFHIGKRKSSLKTGCSIRPGLVHRIDKDTSGLLVVAKNNHTFEELAARFSTHDIEREYQCIIFGKLSEINGTIETYHGRDPNNRLKFSPDVRNGRKAVTHFSVICEYKYFSLIKVNLETGRTHQIRMHMSHIGHPIVNDVLYGGIRKTPDHVLNKLLVDSGRQMLHAGKLGFTLFNEKFSFSSPIPDDMKQVVDHLELISGGK